VSISRSHARQRASAVRSTPTDPCTLILLSAPGARARQVTIPRNWPLLVGFMAVTSLAASLLMGRNVRALYDEQARIHAYSVGLSAELEHRGERFVPRVGSSEAARKPQRATLRLYDVNADSALRVSPFNADGSPNAAAFGRLREFLRCRRTGSVIEMSPRLIVLLTHISQHFDEAELQIISAHRSVDGVVTSDTSQHGKGTAADIRIAGVSVETLAEAARALGAGGVGTYDRHQFVHVDVREQPYSWREGDPARGALRSTEASESGEVDTLLEVEDTSAAGDSGEVLKLTNADLPG
jgi:uncharacterized protein YcbK (DUF882 family)